MRTFKAVTLVVASIQADSAEEAQVKYNGGSPISVERSTMPLVELPDDVSLDVNLAIAVIDKEYHAAWEQVFDSQPTSMFADGAEVMDDDVLISVVNEAPAGNSLRALLDEAGAEEEKDDSEDDIVEKAEEALLDKLAQTITGGNHRLGKYMVFKLDDGDWVITKP